MLSLRTPQRKKIRVSNSVESSTLKIKKLTRKFKMKVNRFKYKEDREKSSHLLLLDVPLSTPFHRPKT